MYRGGGVGKALFTHNAYPPNFIVWSNLAPRLPGGEFSFPKQYCTLFVRGDLDREQISVFDLNSDGINRSVHYVHHILEQKKKSWK